MAPFEPEKNIYKHYTYDEQHKHDIILKQWQSNLNIQSSFSPLFFQILYENLPKTRIT